MAPAADVRLSESAIDHAAILSGVESTLGDDAVEFDVCRRPSTNRFPKRVSGISTHR